MARALRHEKRKAIRFEALAIRHVKECAQALSLI